MLVCLIADNYHAVFHVLHLQLLAGTKIAAVALNQPVFISINAGASWTTSGPAVDWSAISYCGNTSEFFWGQFLEIFYHATAMIIIYWFYIIIVQELCCMLVLYLEMCIHLLTLA